MRPIIGISTYGRVEGGVSRYYTTHYRVPAEYVDAVRRAGGLPVLLPVGEMEPDDLVTLVDGVIITGGADIHPNRYGGDATHPQLTPLDSERDASDMALLQAVLATEAVPLLCICRGAQLLNVALGGTLHVHIPDIRETDIHRGADGGWTVQAVTMDPDAELTTIMGAATVQTYSGHHQALDRLGDGMETIGVAPDGIVEAVRYTKHAWCLGVQWHPEVSADKDPTQQRIFDALVARATAYRQTRRTTP